MTYSSYPVSGGGGSGDVQGPVLSVNNGVVLFDGTSGKTIKDLGVGSANQVLVTDGTTPSFALIADANVSGSAAIAYSKLATLTASRALQSSAGGVIEVSSVTSTELGYVSGVTSSIQTQLNAKEPTISLTANRAVVSSAGGTLAVSATTDTEIGYVSGVTSAIQTQIDSKTGIADNETITGNWTFNNTITGSITGNAGTVTNGAYINVTNSFTSTQNILATTNQLVLGTTNTTTISATAPAASRVYTIPDAGGAADFVMTAGTQTIGGAKTFSADLVVNARIGINTSPSSDYLLHASTSTSDAILAVESTAAGTPLSALSLRATTPSDEFLLAHRSLDDTFYISHNPASYAGSAIAAASVVAIQSGGNVGIGTPSPQERLHLVENTSFALRIENTDAGGGYWNIGQTDNAYGAGGGKLIFVPDSATSSNATVVFTNSGNVGIGTTSPGNLLDVGGINPGDGLGITAAGFSALQRGTFSDQTTTGPYTEVVLGVSSARGHAKGGAIISGREGIYSTTASTQDSYLAFETTLDGVRTEKMRISSAGAVTLGPSTGLGTVNVPTGVATTLFDAGQTQFRNRQIFLTVYDAGTHIGSGAIIFVRWNGASYVLSPVTVTGVGSSGSTVSISGTNIQFSHTAGSTRPISWNYIIV